MSVTKVTTWAVGVLAVLALSGCGADGEVSLPSISVDLPSATRTAEPSVALPTADPTRSAERPPETESQEPPTSEPTTEEPSTGVTLSQVATAIPPGEETEPPAQTPTEEPTEETQTPTEEPTEETTQPEPTESSPTPSETDSETASASASASASTAPDESDGSPVGLWLGLGALAAALAGLIWFLVMNSRRKQWDERLDVERTQGQWVTDELVPALTDPAAPAQQITQYWATAQPTLDELDANLTQLVDDAPDETRAMTVRSIGTALTQVRSAAAAHVALLGTGTTDGQALGTSAAALVTARNQLATALTPTED